MDVAAPNSSSGNVVTSVVVGGPSEKFQMIIGLGLKISLDLDRGGGCH